MDVEIASALIGAGATGIAALAGFGAVLWQIHRQGGLNRTALLDAEARKLKTEMYTDSVVACRTFGDAASDFESALRSGYSDISIVVSRKAQGLGYALPRARYETLADHHRSLSDTLVRFIFLIENRRIIDERLILFRDMLSAANYDLMMLIYGGSWARVLDALPVSHPDGGTHPYEPPPIDQFREVEALLNRAMTILNNMTAWVEDFLVEIQNLMLGEIFKKPVAHRTPLDPSQRVIKLESFAALNEWLDTTAWGLARSKAEADFAATLGLPTPATP